jgi:cardiolipin hydrolase
LCVFTLSDDRIAHEVIAAHARGVNLRFVTDNDKEFDAGSDVARLRTAGVPIRVDRTDAHMHHKFALFDGLWLLNGSYNWTRSACDHNEENLVVTNQPQLVRQFQQQFDMLWDELGE